MRRKGATMDEGTQRLEMPGAADTASGTEVIEFRTFMRERPVACRWSQGRVTGDPELLARIGHMVRGGDWARQPSTVARVISDAVAHPVTIRLVSEPHFVDEVAELDDQLDPDAAPCADGALGDYWLG